MPGNNGGLSGNAVETTVDKPRLELRAAAPCAECGGTALDLTREPCEACDGDGWNYEHRRATPADLVAHVVALPAEEARALLVALLRARPEVAVAAVVLGTCEWTADDEGTWQSACGAAFTFDDGGPVENGQRYCHSCGSRVVVTP